MSKTIRSVVAAWYKKNPLDSSVDTVVSYEKFDFHHEISGSKLFEVCKLSSRPSKTVYSTQDSETGKKGIQKKTSEQFILSAWAAHNDNGMEKWQYEKIKELQTVFKEKNMEFRIRLHPLQSAEHYQPFDDIICDAACDETFLSKYEAYLSHSSTLLLDAFETDCNCFRVWDGSSRELNSPLLGKIPLYSHGAI